MTRIDSEAETPSPQDVTSGVRLSFRRRVVLRNILLVCVLSEIGFVLLDYHVNYGRLIDLGPIRNLVNTTREDGLASWFGVAQTLLTAVTLWLVVLTVREMGRPRVARWGWLILALFFSYMAIDDGAELHERIGSTFKMVQNDATKEAGEPTWGTQLLRLFPSYPWQLLFVPAFGAMGLFMIGFLWFELRDRWSRTLVIASVCCFATAVGFDFVEGLDEYHDWNLYTIIAEWPGVEAFMDERFDRDAFDALRHFSKSIEESIEMLGMTLLWVTFLRHWMRIADPLQVRFDDGTRGRQGA